MKVNKIIYWGTTGLLSAMLLMSAAMYIFKYSDVAGMFTAFGYPIYLIYPLAIAKFSAILVILTQKQSKIKEWAYSALFFEFILAFFAHFMVGDGEYLGAVIAIILLVVSYIFGNIHFKKETV